jgi:hypothetical protein
MTARVQQLQEKNGNLKKEEKKKTREEYRKNFYLFCSNLYR